MNESRKAIRRVDRHSAELEYSRAFEKERPLLREKSLDRGKIDHCGIDLDLAEVGIQGPGQRKRGSEAQPEVGTERAIQCSWFPKRTGDCRVIRCHAGADVGCYFNR